MSQTSLKEQQPKVLVIRESRRFKPSASCYLLNCHHKHVKTMSWMHVMFKYWILAYCAPGWHAIMPNMKDCYCPQIHLHNILAGSLSVSEDKSLDKIKLPSPHWTWNLNISSTLYFNHEIITINRIIISTRDNRFHITPKEMLI